jgi:hypothetical protein
LLWGWLARPVLRVAAVEGTALLSGSETNIEDPPWSFGVVAAANRGLMREPHDYTIRRALRPGVRRDTGEVKCPQERGP